MNFPTRYGHALCCTAVLLALGGPPALAQDAGEAPAPLMHTVAEGDTLASVASHYGVSAEQLRDWNNLEGDDLEVGQLLQVLADAPAAAPSKAPAATAVSPPAKPEKAPRPPRAADASTGHEPAPPTVELSLLGGAARVEEPTFAAHGGLDIGGRVRWHAAKGLRLDLAASDRAHPQTYLSRNPSVEGAASQAVSVSENVQDYRLGVSYDLAEGLGFLASAAGSLDLAAGLDLRLVHLDSAAFAVDAAGPRLGLETRWYPADAFSLTATGGFMPRVLGTAETLSVMGLPSFFWDAGVTAGLDFGDEGGPRFTLLLGWNLDSIVFEHTTRVGQAARAGLSLAL